MIKVITDNAVIEAADSTELKEKVGEIFKADVRDDVTVTYVVTQQPQSRRATLPTE